MTHWILRHNAKKNQITCLSQGFQQWTAQNASEDEFSMFHCCNFPSLYRFIFAHDKCLQKYSYQCKLVLVIAGVHFYWSAYRSRVSNLVLLLLSLPKSLLLLPHLASLNVFKSSPFNAHGDVCRKSFSCNNGFFSWEWTY